MCIRKYVKLQQCVRFHSYRNNIWHRLRFDKKTYSSCDLNSDTSTSQATQIGVDWWINFLPYMHLHIISTGICIRSHIIVEELGMGST